MINLCTLSVETYCTAAALFIAAIVFTIYSIKTAVLVDDYDNPIKESINPEA